MVKKRGDERRDAFTYDEMEESEDSELERGHRHSVRDKFYQWPHVFNLTNCIIGISVLAMPYCLQQCGILLGAVLIFVCSLITKATCHFLYKAAVLSRRKSYEALALYAFGSGGRRLIELLMVLYLMSSIVAFMVVIGDIGPHVLADYLQLQAPTQRLRVLVMVLVFLFVILPLSMVRNLGSLSIISSITVMFYFIFVARMLIECSSKILDGNWSQDVYWWRSEGILTSLPIISMALSCQTQLFCFADCIKEPAISKVDSVVAGAVNLCSAIYAAVGVFGYLAFHDIELHGDILLYLHSTVFTQIIKLSFMLSVAVSIPLMMFPSRIACYNLFLRSDIGEFTVPRMSSYIFSFLTVSILFFNMLIAILIPNVEFVLGLTGALIGSLVTIVIPSLIFIYIAPYSSQNVWLLRCAKMAVFIGLLMLVGSTLATLRTKRESSTVDVILPKTTVQNAIDKIDKDVTVPYVNKDSILNSSQMKQVDEKDAHDANKENGREAKLMLDEIRKRQNEQDKLIENQKAILKELKVHNEFHLKEHRLNETSKTSDNVKDATQNKIDSIENSKKNREYVKETTKTTDRIDESKRLRKETGNETLNASGNLVNDAGKSFSDSVNILRTNSPREGHGINFAVKAEN